MPPPRPSRHPPRANTNATTPTKTDHLVMRACRLPILMPAPSAVPTGKSLLIGEATPASLPLTVYLLSPLSVNS